MRKNSIMRKALSAGLCVAMSGLLLAGCQSNSASETTAAAQTTAAAEAEEAGEAEATEATEAAEEAAPATDFPTKEIEFIVPVNPGGSSDTVARALAKYAEEYLGQLRHILVRLARHTIDELGSSDLVADPPHHTEGTAPERTDP